jgi:hypothetical protein
MRLSLEADINLDGTYMSSDKVRQTPALVLASGDEDFSRRMLTISPMIFSPDFLHSSTVVRDAVWIYNETITHT